MRTGRGSSVSRRTVLFSEGGGGWHGSAPGGSCTRSPAAEQHCLLPREEWRSAQGSEQRYGQGKGHAQAGSDECYRKYAHANRRCDLANTALEFALTS